VRTDQRAEFPAALLGPSRPEVSCEECFEQLDRYLELELADGDANAAFPGVGPHLEGSRACRGEHRSLHALLRTGEDR
jgi:hypothetical protein